MIKFKAQIKGLKEVIQKIEAYDKKLGNDVSTELDNGARNMASMAKAMAPMGRAGALKSTIGFSSLDKYNKEVFANAPYAAYVEFGTGSKVFQAKSGFMFTPEMRTFAMEFYVNGMGRMPARPFMFPALEAEKVEIIKRVRAILLKDLKI